MTYRKHFHIYKFKNPTTGAIHSKDDWVVVDEMGEAYAAHLTKKKAQQLADRYNKKHAKENNKGGLFGSGLKGY